MAEGNGVTEIIDRIDTAERRILDRIESHDQQAKKIYDKVEDTSIDVECQADKMKEFEQLLKDVMHLQKDTAELQRTSAESRIFYEKLIWRLFAALIVGFFTLLGLKAMGISV